MLLMLNLTKKSTTGTINIDKMNYNSNNDNNIIKKLQKMQHIVIVNDIF